MLALRDRFRDRELLENPHNLVGFVFTLIMGTQYIKSSFTSLCSKILIILKTNYIIIIYFTPVAHVFPERYHYKSIGDGLLATMAVFPKTGPVVLLAVKLSLFFIVPVTQDTATFTAPDGTRWKWGSKGTAKQ